MSDFQNEEGAVENSGQDSSIVDGVRAELEEIDSSELTEHAARFEALHKKLADSLNTIDGL
jgi:archaellum component FlaC